MFSDMATTGKNYGTKEWCGGGTACRETRKRIRRVVEKTERQRTKQEIREWENRNPRAEKVDEAVRAAREAASREQSNSATLAVRGRAVSTETKLTPA